MGSVVGEVVASTLRIPFLLIVSNPLDAMVYHAHKALGIPQRSESSAWPACLDTARMRTFIAQELNVSVEDVQAYVLGGHGDTMVPLVRYTTVGGIPLEKWLPQDRVEAIVQRTRDGGGEIVSLLKTGSAFYAPSAAVLQMVDSILLDKRRILPAAAYLDGEYGVSGVFIGVPVILGENGVEKVIDLELTDEEQAGFQKSVEAVNELVEAMANLG